jgi:hypothetical protein
MNNRLDVLLFKKIIWKCWSFYKNSLDGLKKLSKLCYDIQTGYYFKLYSYGDIYFDISDSNEDSRKKDLWRTIVYTFFESNDFDLLNIFFTNLAYLSKKYPNDINYNFTITIPDPSERFESVIDNITDKYEDFLSFNISCFDYFTSFIDLDIDYRIFLLKQIKNLEIISDKDELDDEYLPFSPVLNIIEYNNKELFNHFDYNFYGNRGSIDKSIFHKLFRESSIFFGDYMEFKSSSFSYEEHSYLLKIILSKPIDSIYFDYICTIFHIENYIAFVLLNRFPLPLDNIINIINYIN